MMGALQRVFNALRTSYFTQVNFEYDLTQAHISPTSGQGGNNQGQNNNNQGQQ
jgi:hypothetical protein